MSNTSSGNGHGTLGVVLGIIGIILAVPACFFFGIIGGAAAGILGLAALLLGIGARKYGKGIGAIVTGVIAVVLAVAMTAGMTSLLTDIRQKALETDQGSLIARYLTNPSMGIMGIINELPRDEAGIQELMTELQAYR